MFRLGKVIGVLVPDATRSRREKPRLPAGLGGVEIRADLFAHAADAFAALESISSEVPVLFTCRIREQGGAWDGDELARGAILREALARGATMVDAELGSLVARELIADGFGPQVLVSMHDFTGMPSPGELDRFTTELESGGTAAVKLVPTAGSLSDALRMLEWVAGARAGGPRRVGFAMGERGLASRILSVAHGGAFTYGSLSDAVAPGQPRASDLLDLYRVPSIGRETTVLGVAGNPVGHSLSPHMHNPALAAAGIDAVYLPFLLASLDELEPAWDALRLGGLSVTIPFKEEAFRLANEPDERSSRAGAANTLVRDPPPDGSLRTRPRLRAFNTDFDGVLVPLRARLTSLAGVRVAVLGNGGAARGAVEALKDERAAPTLVYRNRERGSRVARELGIPGTTFAELRADEFQVIVNATSLGLGAGDPSPLPEVRFRPDQIAFDMVYTRATAFLAAARDAGAKAIDGAEMLIAQGLVQFRLFTGREADPDVFARGFRDGLEARLARA